MKAKFFELALREAEKAEKKDEVPVGAILVHNDKVIARAHNLRETKQQAAAHAEVLLVEKACKKLGSWRLEDCDVYVTLEPCPMCAGVLSQARVRNVYYGAKDPKSGVESVGISIHDNPKLNHRYHMQYHPVPNCSAVLSAFFKKKRKKA